MKKVRGEQPMNSPKKADRIQLEALHQIQLAFEDFATTVMRGTFCGDSISWVLVRY